MPYLMKVSELHMDGERLGLEEAATQARAALEAAAPQGAPREARGRIATGVEALDPEPEGAARKTTKVKRRPRRAVMRMERMRRRVARRTVMITRTTEMTSSLRTGTRVGSWRSSKVCGR
jgi:hypothetical protein